MPLKIIGAGYGRTGTMSTYAALNQLGFPCYHMIEVFKNRPHAAFWHKVALAPAGASHDWEQVFAKYTAAVDFPASCVWRELMAAYPDAKVLLTLHPKGAAAWYESCVETIYRPETMWQSKVMAFVMPPMRKFGEMVRKLVWERTLKGTMTDRVKAMAEYEANIADVIATVPKERLLVFSVDQGWEPLCKFLGVPVPATPFPSVNDRASMKKQMTGMNRIVYAIIAAGVLVVAGAIYALVRAIS